MSYITIATSKMYGYGIEDKLKNVLYTKEVKPNELTIFSFSYPDWDYEDEFVTSLVTYLRDVVTSENYAMVRLGNIPGDYESHGALLKFGLKVDVKVIK